jgi:hypothetical protein
MLFKRIVSPSIRNFKNGSGEGVFYRKMKVGGLALIPTSLFSLCTDRHVAHFIMYIRNIGKQTFFDYPEIIRNFNCLGKLLAFIDTSYYL